MWGRRFSFSKDIYINIQVVLHKREKYQINGRVQKSQSREIKQHWNIKFTRNNSKRWENKCSDNHS